MNYYLESEINVPLDNFAGDSVYFGAKHLMAYAQLCLIAEETGRWGETVNEKTKKAAPAPRRRRRVVTATASTLPVLIVRLPVVGLTI